MFLDATPITSAAATDVHTELRLLLPAGRGALNRCLEAMRRHGVMPRRLSFMRCPNRRERRELRVVAWPGQAEAMHKVAADLGRSEL